MDVEGFEEEFSGGDEGCGIFGIEVEFLGELDHGLAEAFDAGEIFQEGGGGDFIADLQ